VDFKLASEGEMGVPLPHLENMGKWIRVLTGELVESQNIDAVGGFEIVVLIAAAELATLDASPQRCFRPLMSAALAPGIFALARLSRV
jgi:hypothetical protein